MWFSSHVLPFEYDEAAKAPMWEAFLQQIFEGDVERITLLQEWFGYCLTPDTSQQKAMIFYGEPRAGKTTVANVLIAMVSSTSRLNLQSRRCCV